MIPSCNLLRISLDYVLNLRDQLCIAFISHLLQKPRQKHSLKSCLLFLNKFSLKIISMFSFIYLQIVRRRIRSHILDNSTTLLESREGWTHEQGSVRLKRHVLTPLLLGIFWGVICLGVVFFFTKNNFFSKKIIFHNNNKF